MRRRLEGEPRQHLRRCDLFWKPFTLLQSPLRAVTAAAASLPERSPLSASASPRDPLHLCNCRPVINIAVVADGELHPKRGTRNTRRPSHACSPAILVRRRSSFWHGSRRVRQSCEHIRTRLGGRVRYQRRPKIPDPCLQPRLHPPNGAARPAKSSNSPAVGNRRSSLFRPRSPHSSHAFHARR